MASLTFCRVLPEAAGRLYGACVRHIAAVDRRGVNGHISIML